MKNVKLTKLLTFAVGLQASAPGTSITSNLCHGELCCSFTYSVNVEATTTQAYVYGMAVYHGNRTFDGFADGGVVVWHDVLKK